MRDARAPEPDGHPLGLRLVELAQRPRPGDSMRSGTSGPGGAARSAPASPRSRSCRSPAARSAGDLQDVGTPVVTSASPSNSPGAAHSSRPWCRGRSRRPHRPTTRELGGSSQPLEPDARRVGRGRRRLGREDLARRLVQATTSVNVPPVSIPMRRRPDLSGIKPNARRGCPFSNATQASRSASRPSRTFWKKATSSLSARRRGRGRSTSTIRTMLEPVLSERPRLMTTTRSDR